MSQASSDYKSLAAKSKAQLEEIFVAGDTPDVDQILGWEYRGYNHPKLYSLLGIRKFIKGFFHSEAGEAYGCNTPVKQNGIDDDWVSLPSAAHPKRFGFYRIAPVDPEARDNNYLHSLLLDYGRGKNPLLDPTKLIRDYVVRVNRGSDDLLLGKAYLALGPARPATNFFILERHQPFDIDDPKVIQR